MKIRKSFVSNSSSCSFFIWLKTDRDIEEFNKIKDELKQKFGKYILTVYPSPNNRWSVLPDDKIEKGNAISICTGEDNEGWFRNEQLDSVYIYVTDKYRKFRIFMDPDAHYTYGSLSIDKAKDND